METLSERLTRQSGTSFYYAFRVLTREKRRAIFALYSFCRVVDDCVDEEGGEGEAGRAARSAWGSPWHRRTPGSDPGPRPSAARFSIPGPRAPCQEVRARWPRGPRIRSLPTRG